MVPPMCADALRLRPSGVRRAGAQGNARHGGIPARYRGPDDAAAGCPSGPGNCGLAPCAARCLFHSSPVLVPVIAARTFRLCPQGATGHAPCQCTPGFLRRSRRQCNADTSLSGFPVFPFPLRVLCAFYVLRVSSTAAYRRYVGDQAGDASVVPSGVKGREPKPFAFVTTTRPPAPTTSSRPPSGESAPCVPATRSRVALPSAAASATVLVPP